MDSSIHNVKEVSVTSRELGKGLGMTTRVIVSSQPSWSKETTTEEIILFSNTKKSSNILRGWSYMKLYLIILSHS